MYLPMQTATAECHCIPLSLSLCNLTILELTEIHLPLPSECRIKRVYHHTSVLSSTFLLNNMCDWRFYIFLLYKSKTIYFYASTILVILFFRVLCGPGYTVLICCVAENDCSSDPQVSTLECRGLQQDSSVEYAFVCLTFFHGIYN